jgi:hypothetical protein
MADILSRTEAAGLLEVDERTVRRYEASGRLPKASIQSSRGGLKRAFYPRDRVIELKRALAVEAFMRRSDEQKRRDSDKALEDERAFEKFSNLEAAALEFELAELREKREAEAGKANAQHLEAEREQIRKDENAALRRQLIEDRHERERAADETREAAMRLFAGMATLGTVAVAWWLGKKPDEDAIKTEPTGMAFAEALALMQSVADARANRD